MGSIVGKAMDENMKKNQEFMLEAQRMTVERQIQMQNFMREKMMAMQLAKSRELFIWLTSGYTLIALGCIGRWRQTRNPVVMGPLIPLSLVLAYNYDLAYGSKLYRIRNEAERMMKEESDILNLPLGLPTVDLIDERRKQK